MLNARLQAAIADLPALRGLAQFEVLQCSSAGATGAVILHVWVDAEPHPRLVIKTPRDPRTRHTLQSEWEHANRLASVTAIDQLMPSPVACFRADEAEYYAYQGVPGRTMFSRYRNRIVMGRDRMLDRFTRIALQTAIVLHSTETRTVPGHNVAEDLLRDLSWLRENLPDFPSRMSARAFAAVDTITATHGGFASGRIHGDFSPYNLLVTSLRADGVVHLIDWEHTELDRPQHLDVFRFMSACSMMGRRCTDNVRSLSKMIATEGAAHPDLLRRWLTRLCPGLPATPSTELLEALWWHFWVHAARREQERLADPADLRDSVYLPALRTLAHAN